MSTDVGGSGVRWAWPAAGNALHASARRNAATDRRLGPKALRREAVTKQAMPTSAGRRSERCGSMLAPHHVINRASAPGVEPASCPRDDQPFQTWTVSV